MEWENENDFVGKSKVDQQYQEKAVLWNVELVLDGLDSKDFFSIFEEKPEF